jgi:hypothetical protein
MAAGAPGLRGGLTDVGCSAKGCFWLGAKCRIGLAGRKCPFELVGSLGKLCGLTGSREGGVRMW